MHISEGVLQGEILATGAVLSTGLLIYSLKNLKNQNIPKIAVLSAVFFLGSFIHIPIGISSVHLILTGLVGAFLGYGAVLAIFVALFLQGLLFGYGGLSTLGVNTFIMAFPAIIAFWIFSLDVSGKIKKNIQWFLVGSVPILISASLLSLTLVLNGEEFYAVSSLAFVSNLPIMIIEGIISLFALNFIEKVAPRYLRK
ncbi:MAG: cobalamin biosynthesis protein CbiM [Proteobacteria bacterium]|nr:MAG: cobalamin biosynthesis protein CbiM [Pseudomonadota bacterium]